MKPPCERDSARSNEGLQAPISNGALLSFDRRGCLSRSSNPLLKLRIESGGRFSKGKFRAEPRLSKARHTRAQPEQGMHVVRRRKTET